MRRARRTPPHGSDELAPPDHLASAASISWNRLDQTHRGAAFLGEAWALAAQLVFLQFPKSFLPLDALRHRPGIAAFECLVGAETSLKLLVDFLWDRGCRRFYVLPPKMVRPSQQRYRLSRWAGALPPGASVPTNATAEQGAIVLHSPSHSPAAGGLLQRVPLAGIRRATFRSPFLLPAGLDCLHSEQARCQDGSGQSATAYFTVICITDGKSHMPMPTLQLFRAKSKRSLWNAWMRFSPARVTRGRSLMRIASSARSGSRAAS